jgi:hypothetical protein
VGVVGSHDEVANCGQYCGTRARILAEDAAGKRNEVEPPFRYHTEILDALASHGLVPRADTPPGRLRDAVRDLYRYEIKRLRASLLAGTIPKRDYAAHVVALRRKYPVLSVPVELWVVGQSGGDGENGDTQPQS